MARNPICRRVCAEPACRTFLPEKGCEEMIIMRVEELEALRLCDLEGWDQDRAAARMLVSRGTFQRILYQARQHSAQALVSGKGIRIQGGHYKVAQAHCQCERRCEQCCFQSEKGDDIHE